MPLSTVCSGSEGPEKNDIEELFSNTFNCVGAIIQGDIANFIESINRGVLINGLEENIYYPKLIFTAVEYNRLEMVEILLDRGANIDIIDFEGWTALMEAAYFNNIDIAKLLIDRNANVNVVDSEGNTALSLAKGRGNFQIVEFLINSEPDKGLVNFKQPNYVQDNFSLEDSASDRMKDNAYSSSLELSCTENNFLEEITTGLIAELAEES